MIGVFDSIAQAGDVNASIIAESISKSSIHTISGLLILIFTVIIWGVIKTIKNSQIKKG
jgi:biopolymer transport protein ExbB/TolQ